MQRFLTGTIVLLGCATGFASDWPQFRGPDGNGVGHDANFPIEWTASQNIGWSAEIPGGGWSSPVVVNGRVFVTTAVSKENERPKGFGEGVTSMRQFARAKSPQEPFSFEVHCLSLADGELLWSHVVAAQTPPHKIHPSNSYATESPAADQDRVYVYFGAIGVVACLDQDGAELWKRDLGAYRTANDFGTGSSLALHEGRVFVQSDNQEDSFLCALDAQTGEDVWRISRSGKTSWSSPVIWRNKNRTELVVCGAGDVTSFDPSTGEQYWTLTGTGGAFSASPTMDMDRIYFGNSGRTSRGPLVAVNATASGELDWDDVGDEGVAWSQPSAAPGMCSPVVVEGKLYVFSRGIMSCHDAATGERLYRERTGGGGRVAASLWSAGSNLFVLDESGQTSVIDVADEFKLSNTNDLDGLFWSTPSIAGDSLLLREASRIYCVRK